MTHLLNLIISLLPPTRLFAFKCYLLRIVGLNIEQNVKFCGPSKIYGRGALSIGRDSWVGPGNIFYTNQDAEISIGANCDLAPGVTFVTGSHHLGDADRRAGPGIASNIVVNNGVWIGCNATILGGVVVGSGSIIAAGSLVTRNVPENTLVAGVPAKKIKDL